MTALLTRRTTDVGDSITLVVARQRVTNHYDVMDAAYCSSELREHKVKKSAQQSSIHAIVIRFA